MIATKTRLPTERYQIDLILMTSRKFLFQIKFFNKMINNPYYILIWILDFGSLINTVVIILATIEIL